MKKALMCMLAAGCCVGSYATDARVISMGRHDAFFMDEVSIFRNPANISIYPNMVYGSYGWYMPDQQKDANNDLSALGRNNRDPEDPFFGAVISYSLDQGTDGGGQYPMLSLGAVFNRRDEMLDYVTPGNSKYIASGVDSLEIPVGKVDLLLGYVLKNGGMLGGGAYMAMQKRDDNGKRLETTLYKGNLGLNWPVAKAMDLELSIGGGTITAIGQSDDGKVKTIANRDYFGRIEGRLFSALAALNGDFVPHFRVDMMEFDVNNIFQVDVSAGIGLNINVDKGFFWGGLQFLYGQKDSSHVSAREHVGGRVSFGIERNIVWDWFVIRVGGQKELIYITEGPNKGYLRENSSNDASDNDLVSLGFGINIENRLRIDFVAAEDIAYTFTNLISGPQHHLFNRVSATYSF